MFQTKVVEEIKAHILFSVTFSRKSCRLWDNVEKYCTARQARDDSKAHALCMLENSGYRQTLRMCNTYVFSTATMVTRTRFIITLYVQCLSCIIIIIESIVPSRNIGCLWVLSTSVYQLLGTLVHFSFYPLPWLLTFSSCFSVFLSSCFLEGSKVGQPLVLLHPLFLMCDLSI